jgi:Uma2 family endonuclease
MNIALRRPLAREDFFLWAERQEEKYEFDGFQPVAMTAGTNNHGIICRNLHGQLYNLLRGRPCQSMNSAGGGVATTGNKVRYPDATVTCSPIVGTERLVPDPVIVFEVPSPNSVHEDSTVKKLEYQAVPTIRRYVLIDQTKAAVTVHARAGEAGVAGDRDDAPG